jgi:hypothetical protein
MRDLSFIATNKDGKQVKYQTIATYEDENTKKNYIVYTDNTYDDNKKLKIYYSLYKIVNNKMQLIKIISNEDKKIALELVKELISK